MWCEYPIQKSNEVAVMILALRYLSLNCLLLDCDTDIVSKHLYLECDFVQRSMDKPTMLFWLNSRLYRSYAFLSWKMCNCVLMYIISPYNTLDVKSMWIPFQICGFCYFSQTHC